MARERLLVLELSSALVRFRRDEERRVEGLEVRIAALEAVLMRVFGVLERLPDGCPVCCPSNKWGHRRECPIGVALRPVDRPVEL